MAVIAGNDILEVSENSKRAIKLVRNAVRDGRISMDRIDESVRKILIAKYWAGVYKRDTVSTQNVADEVNSAESLALLKQLADASMTVLNGIGGIKALAPEKRTAVISIGTPGVTAFQRELGSFYKNSVFFSLDKDAKANSIAKVVKELRMFDQVIIGIHDTRSRPGNGMELSADLKMLVRDMAGKNAVFALFANPYNLAGLPGIENAKSLVVGYQKDEYMQKAAAEVIENVKVATGRLPVTVNSIFKFNSGL